MKTLLLLASLLLPLALVAQSSPLTIKPGDSDASGTLCMQDAVVIIFNLFRDGRQIPCPDAADADRSGAIEVTDCVLILRHLFNGEIIPDCPISCGQSVDGGGNYYE